MGICTAATTLRVTCDVRKASNIARRMFGLNGMNHIPGVVIQVALCLQGGGHMEQLRRHLASVIRSKLVIHRFRTQVKRHSATGRRPCPSFFQNRDLMYKAFEKFFLCC